MRFYVLKNPKVGQTDAVTDFSTSGSPTGNAPRCPACGKAIGMRPLLLPIKVELELWGRRFGDVAFGPGNELLVSERFKDAFLKEGLTGLSTFTPVEVTKIIRKRKVTEPAPRYFAVLPERSRAAIDDRASGMVRDAPWTCEECRTGRIRRMKRAVLEDGTWPGEDIFFPRGLPGTRITSQRFREFCDRHAFANCLLIEAEHYGFDFFPGDAASVSPSNSGHTA